MSAREHLHRVAGQTDGPRPQRDRNERQRVAEVLELIRRVRDKGLPVVLISHNMPHVFEIADRIHVARLGKRAAVLNPKKISMSDTVAVMTGAMKPEDIPAECLA